MSRGIENVRTKLGAVATAVAVVLLAGGAAQAYPIAGIFESEEFPGGDVMDGRWSESLPEGDTDSLCQIGSIINAATATNWAHSGRCRSRDSSRPTRSTRRISAP